MYFKSRNFEQRSHPLNCLAAANMMSVAGSFYPMTNNIGYRRSIMSSTPRLSRIPRISRRHIRSLGSLIKEAIEKNWPVDQWKRAVLGILHGSAATIHDDEVGASIPHVEDHIKLRFVDHLNDKLYVVRCSDLLNHDLASVKETN
jgi:hypothetical protein